MIELKQTDNYDYLSSSLELDLHSYFKILEEEILKMDFTDKTEIEIDEMIKGLFS